MKINWPGGYWREVSLNLLKALIKAGIYLLKLSGRLANLYEFGGILLTGIH